MANRGVVASLVGLLSGAPAVAAERSLEVVTFADSAFVQFTGSAAADQVCTLMRVAGSSFASTPGMQLRIVHKGSVLAGDADPFQPVTDGGEPGTQEILEAFAQWVNGPGAAVVGPADAVVLISGRHASANTVGLAYTAGACSLPNHVALIAGDHYTNLPFDAATLAHELGHLAGMCHDPPATRSGNCPTLPPGLMAPGACANGIMAASSNPSAPATTFSACSVFDGDDWITNGNSSCAAAGPWDAGAACPEVHALDGGEWTAPPDSGVRPELDAGTDEDAGADAGSGEPLFPFGCSCGSAGGGVWVTLAALMLALRTRLVRRED